MEKAIEFQKNIYFCFMDYAKSFDSVDHSKLWKILKEMGISDSLTCLLRNLYAGLRVPWTARKSNQSILKEISPACSLKGLMLKLKLQYFGHLLRRVDSLEKTLILGKIEGKRRRGGRGRDSTTDSMDRNLSTPQETVRKAW